MSLSNWEATKTQNRKQQLDKALSGRQSGSHQNTKRQGMKWKQQLGKALSGCYLALILDGLQSSASTLCSPQLTLLGGRDIRSWAGLCHQTPLQVHVSPSSTMLRNMALRQQFPKCGLHPSSGLHSTEPPMRTQ